MPTYHIPTTYFMLLFTATTTATTIIVATCLVDRCQRGWAALLPRRHRHNRHHRVVGTGHHQTPRLPRVQPDPTPNHVAWPRLSLGPSPVQLQSASLSTAMGNARPRKHFIEEAGQLLEYRHHFDRQESSQGFPTKDCQLAG